MGIVRRPAKVKLITGLITNDLGLFDKAIHELEKRLKNTVDFRSNIIDFIHTDYYRGEMGSPLKRQFVSFKKTVPLENVGNIKLLTNKIEQIFATNGKRPINIDPGYLDLSKLVLFSTKDYSHRIHIGKGIFAEITLFYKDKKFNPRPWTYPDYKTDAYIAVFDTIRQLYKNDIEGKRC